MSTGKFATLELAPPLIESRDVAGGGFILSSPVALSDYPDNICSFLHSWARRQPNRTFLAERGENGEWNELGYQAALDGTRAVAASLLSHGLRPGDRVLLLSENSVDHAVLQLASMYVGIIAVPVSPAYSLMSRDFARLRQVFELTAPAMIYADDGERYRPAIESLGSHGTTLVFSCNRPSDGTALHFEDLRQGEPQGTALAEAYAAVGPDTIAKILFTSGSTGVPKGVINTQRMLCSNQQAIAQVWPFVELRPPVLLDWLPWNHTFGGNHNIGLVLRNGGTLFIDGGKPTPALIDNTIRNLRDISPTVYFNVPRGYAMLLPYLEADPALRDKFFERLDLIFYSGAALPQDLWQRLERLSLASRGVVVPMTSAWGATETSPAATAAHFPLERAGNIGVPIPGTEIKFEPNGDKLEMRVRGPQVTPGYYRRDDLSREAFDEDGFYLIGDAGRLADPMDPSKGIEFDGRTAEEFKLLSGTWVSAGKIRIAALDAAAPLIQDAVVTGHDRDEVGLLVFPNIQACRSALGLDDAATVADIVSSDLVRTAIADGLGRYNADHRGSSERIARVLLMSEPPSIDDNEITDKGYINQRAVLDRRKDLVARLYSGHPDVIRV